MGYDYAGMSFQEKKAQEGVPPSVIFGMSLLFVFLILAALYESWTLPFSVLLGTPVAVFGAFAALWARGMENNIYAQIGLVMLIGMAAKNAILIVEFAKLACERGAPLLDAALEGARLRLRPIIMTSLRLHSRLRAALVRVRIRGCRQTSHGHDGDRRDGGRDADRDLPYSRDLLRRRAFRGQPPPPARTARRARSREQHRDGLV